MTPAEMAALHALCFTHPRPWTEQEFAVFLDRPHALACSLEHGFIVGHIGGPDVDLLTLAVHPEHRRQGIAQRLLCGFEEEALRRGGQSVFLEVADGNDAAQALYAAAGYVEVGTRKDYYSAPNGMRISASVLHKKL